MKFPCRIIVAVIAMVLCCAAIGSAEWRIDIESKTVSPGETGVTVDITGYWDLELTQISLPIVVLEVGTGSFWTGSLPVDTVGGPVVVGVEWKWEVPGWATVMEQMRPGLRDGTWDETCDCDIATPPARDTLYNGVSPDHFVITASGLGTNEPAHPDGRTFLTLTFDVTSPAVTGSFILDTACYSCGQNTITLVDGETYTDHGPEGPGVIEPGDDFDGFNKGVITIQVPNEAPVWDPITPKDVDEGANLNFGVSASDADGDPLTLTAEEVPTNAIFTDNGDDTGTFDFSPVVGQAGTYNVRFIASDGSLADTEMVEVTVNEDPNSILEAGEGVPTEYALGQNFPNPFNASTKIDFALRQGGHAKLVVFNILGQRISTLVDEYLPAGPQSASWNGTDATGKVVPSGLYFYRLTAGDFSEMKKMVLMK